MSKPRIVVMAGIGMTAAASIAQATGHPVVVGWDLAQDETIKELPDPGRIPMAPAPSPPAIPRSWWYRHPRTHRQKGRNRRRW